MDSHNLKKKALVSHLVQFLGEEASSPKISEEKKESIEVAIQCLEAAYEITGEDRQRWGSLDLLRSINLPFQEVPPEQLPVAEEYKTLGNNAMKENRYDEAVTHYTKAIEANPQNAVYFCNRAAAYSRLDNNEEAIKDCQQALILDPNYGKAYGRLGIAYSNLNRWAEAVQSYEQSLKFDPDNVGYQTNLQLARERLIDSMESAAPPQHRPIDISQFINNESFVNMAQQMMANPEFQNIMSGIMAMSQSGDTNFEALLQAGQNLANRMQHEEPGFVEDLRRRFDPMASGDATTSRDQQEDDAPAGDAQ